MPEMTFYNQVYVEITVCELKTWSPIVSYPVLCQMLLMLLLPMMMMTTVNEHLHQTIITHTQLLTTMHCGKEEKC